MPEFYRVTDRHLIEVRGRDRIQWLHNLCTNDILHLATGRRGDTLRKGERVRLDRTPPGRGCYAAFTNRQGKMVAEAKVRLFPDHVLLESGEPKLLETLGGHVIMEDVEVRARQAPIHQMFGAAIAELFPGLPAVAFPTIPGKSGTAEAGPLPLFWFHHVLEKDLLISPTPFGVDLVGAFSPPQTISEEEYEARRIEAGWPRWGVDMDSSVLPMEAGLEPVAVSYTKGCYLGQEVIQRVKTYSEPPERLVSLSISGTDVPARGARILADGKEAGRVTSATRLPATGAVVGLGYVRKGFTSPGTTVTIAPETAAAVRPLAWHAKLSEWGAPRF